jgi:Protein of unknown function (DUF3156)
VALERNVEAFERIGFRQVGTDAPLGVRLDSEGGGIGLALRMASHGRFFGGSFALEVSSAEPVLPATGGLNARGRGVVRLQRVTFRPRAGDADAGRLARRLEADPSLLAALRAVHFERIRVAPDGRPVIRHMGGSVVWVLVPPLVRAVPLVSDQARATAAALEAFALAGRS